MGHIVFGAPGIDRFHLHDRLHRELAGRGHCVTTLLLDPVAAAFWRQQGQPCCLLGRSAAVPSTAPLAELAATECQRRGLSVGSRQHRRTAARVERELARWLPPLQRWFAGAAVDLVLLHGRRDAAQALLHFVARQAGVLVLWTGDGLLPHTLQHGERGLDGDGAPDRRGAIDFRGGTAATGLLHACLANLLGRTTPCALAQRPLRVPPLRERLQLAARALPHEGLAGARRAVDGWREAFAPLDPPLRPFELPREPFVAVLLQDDDDPRRRLDAAGAPSATHLAAAVSEALRTVAPELPLAVVLPPRELPQRSLRALAAITRCSPLPATAAAEAAVTATCVVTVNHPLGIAALLAGTPLVHLGRALYGLPGVTLPTTTGDLAGTLRTALGAVPQANLRERFLTDLLQHRHVWCSATQPDHNGLVGLVQAIEARLGSGPPAAPQLAYRPGPAWPLAAERPHR